MNKREHGLQLIEQQSEWAAAEARAGLRIDPPDRWEGGLRCVQGFLAILALAVFLLVAIVTVSGAQEPEDVGEVIVCKLEAIRQECLPGPPASHDRGCSQNLAREDYLRGWKRNWASRDFQNGRGNYRGFDYCDGPSRWAGRGMYRLLVQGEIWVVIRQRIKPPLAAALIDHFSYYFDQVHCWEDPLQIGDVYGAYAKAFIPTRYQFGAFPTDLELLELAAQPPINPSHQVYWDAYEMVQGATEPNRYPPGSDLANRYAWDNREAVFALMADGPITDQHPPVAVWETAKKLSEWVILFAAHVPEDWQDNFDDLIDLGWPLMWTPGMDAGADWIYANTGLANDPGYIFLDVDVVVEETTWGRIKGTFAE